jgi:Ran-binding protein 3
MGTSLTYLQVPAGSGFSNTSAASPFAAMSPKPQAPKTSDRPELLPQTSDDKFKASGFGSFSNSAASPFGGLASPASKSPFGGATGNKLSSFGAPAANQLSSFAGSTAPSTAPASGFGALGSSNKSAFGGSTFGSSLGGGFAAISGAKSALSSFETPADLTIKGLTSKSAAFGTPGHERAETSDDEGGDDDASEKDATEEDRKSGQPLLSQQRTSTTHLDTVPANLAKAHETGEEGEITLWTGRAKLYTMSGEGTTKAWKERGVGTFKFNMTVDEPKKARFVLRADGTHRLLLNAAVTKQLVFGGDSNGEKPKEGRLLFNSPTTDGELEMHLLKVDHNLHHVDKIYILTFTS